MTITQELLRLGNSARRLNHGSDRLNRSIERIDALLGRLMIGLDYIHPRPVGESTSLDQGGKRVIELAYLGYLKVDKAYHLAIKTVKVLESRLALATEAPGSVVALTRAPRRMRYAAVDELPHLVSGLAQQVDEMVAAMERRQATAEALLDHLESVASEVEASGSHPRLDAAPVRHNTVPAADSSAQMPVDVPAASSAGRRNTVPTPDSGSYVRADVPSSQSGGRKTVPIGSGVLRGLQDD